MVTKIRYVLVAALPLLAGCNAVAVGLGVYANHLLTTQSVTGALKNPPAAVAVGYLAWTEYKPTGERTERSHMNFDLVKDTTVRFDGYTSQLTSDGKFTLEIQPTVQSVVDGAYVVFAWDDINKDGVFDGNASEKRAPEVYRVRGQAANQNLWSAEKFVFTNTKLSLEYVDLNQLEFNF